MDSTQTIRWHDAFFEAIQLELHQYQQYLDFTQEYQLSKEALKMDVLIIKKQPGTHIGKNIGRIFRTHNIVEFKSETDSLSIHDYNKVMGYAFLYSAFTQTDISEITLTLSVTLHPKALLAHLTKNRSLTVREMESGIYYIEGEAFPVQIIESKRLNPEENLFIRNLRSNLTPEDISMTAEAYKQLKPLENKNAYFDRLIQANLKSLEEAMNMSEAAMDIFLKVAQKDDWLDRKLAQRDAARELERLTAIAQKMLSRGHHINEIAEVTELPYETVADLAAKNTL